MYRSKKHREFIRAYPCLICGNSEVDAHHERLNRGGVALKPPDSHCVPLCRAHHQEQENIGSKAFWDKYNIDIKMKIIELLTQYLEEINEY